MSMNRKASSVPFTRPVVSMSDIVDGFDISGYLPVFFFRNLVCLGVEPERVVAEERTQIASRSPEQMMASGSFFLLYGLPLVRRV